MLASAQLFGLFSKKNRKLFASFQIYIYICTKNVAPRRSYSEKLREEKGSITFNFILLI